MVLGTSVFSLLLDLALRQEFLFPLIYNVLESLAVLYRLCKLLFQGSNLLLEVRLQVRQLLTSFVLEFRNVQLSLLKSRFNLRLFLGKFNILTLNSIDFTFTLLNHIMSFLEFSVVSLLAALGLPIELVTHLCLSLSQSLLCLHLQISKLLLELLL